MLWQLELPTLWWVDTSMMTKGEVNSSTQIPYMIMMLICLAGSVATSFLPETLGAKLPETLEAS